MVRSYQRSEAEARFWMIQLRRQRRMPALIQNGLLVHRTFIRCYPRRKASKLPSQPWNGEGPPKTLFGVKKLLGRPFARTVSQSSWPGRIPLSLLETARSYDISFILDLRSGGRSGTEVSQASFPIPKFEAQPLGFIYGPAFCGNERLQVCVAEDSPASHSS
jgi:hypothetical protein